MKRAILTTMATLACALPSRALNLSGTVIDLDSLPKSGVHVDLAGTEYSAVTGPDGTWSIRGGSTELSARTATVTGLASHLVLKNGRIHLAFSGRDAFGKPVGSDATVASVFSSRAAGRATAAVPDTLIYSWNGKTILRDTISLDSLNTAGITRHFDTTVNPSITHGYVLDAQNHIYRTTRIADQLWLAENLAYKVDSSWCYHDSAANCDRYGRLYQWAAAMDIDPSFDYSIWSGSDSLHQGICPQGWHLPSNAEWTVMLNKIDSSRSGKVLRSKYTWFPQTDTAAYGRDSVGFNALASGYRNSNGDFGNLNLRSAFWSSTQTDDVSPYTGWKGAFVWTGHFVIDSLSASRFVNYKDLGFSLRCVEGASAPTLP